MSVAASSDLVTPLLTAIAVDVQTGAMFDPQPSEESTAELPAVSQPRRGPIARFIFTVLEFWVHGPRGSQKKPRKYATARRLEQREMQKREVEQLIACLLCLVMFALPPAILGACNGIAALSDRHDSKCMAVWGGKSAFLKTWMSSTMAAVVMPCFRRAISRLFPSEPDLLSLITAVDVSEIAADYDCCVCLSHETEDNGNTGPWCKLVCGHQFHEGCLLEWFERERRCPICRKDIFGTPHSPVCEYASPELDQRMTSALVHLTEEDVDLELQQALADSQRMTSALVHLTEEEVDWELQQALADSLQEHMLLSNLGGGSASSDTSDFLLS